MFEIDALIAFIHLLLRVNTPILFAALAVLISNRAGVLNIGVEGMMLLGAFAAVMASGLSGNVWFGLLAAIVAGAIGGAILSFTVHVLQVNLFLSGIAFNIAASAVTTLFLYILTGDRGLSSSLSSGVLPTIEVRFADYFGWFGAIVNGHHILTYCSLLAASLISGILYFTVFGLRLRAASTPHAAMTIGIAWLQFYSLLLSGILAALGGAFLSMGVVSWFAKDMVAGRGFIGLAADLMGYSTIFWVVISSLILSLGEVLSLLLQSFGWSSHLVHSVPYVLPLLVMVVFFRRINYSNLFSTSLKK